MTYAERVKSPLFRQHLLRQQRRQERERLKWEIYHEKLNRKQQKEEEKFRGELEAKRLILKRQEERNQRESALYAATAFDYAKQEALRLKQREYRKIGMKIRSRIWQAFLRQKATKSGKTISLLGCSFATFKRHLERQFRDGMTWENHGIVWEIDHIKPCCSFNLKNRRDQRRCFSYKNLQPLYTKENRKKGKRYP